MALFYPGDGSGTVVLADNPAQAGRAAWFYAGWMRHDSRAAASRVFWCTGSGRIEGFSYAPGGPAYRASIGMGGVQKSLDLAAPAAIALGAWYHIAVGCSGGMAEGWVNGVSVGTVAVSGTTDDQGTTGFGGAGIGQDGWNGALAEWAQWNGVNFGATVAAALASGQLDPRDLGAGALLWAMWGDSLIPQPEVDDSGRNTITSPTLGAGRPAADPPLLAVRASRRLRFVSMGGVSSPRIADLAVTLPLGAQMAGSLTIDAALSATLPLSFGGAASVSVDVALAVTLPLSFTGAGQVGSASTNAALAVTLPLSFTAAGSLAVDAVLSAALPLTFVGAASVGVTAALAVTLPLSFVGAASIAVDAALSVTLSLTFAATGSTSPPSLLSLQCVDRGAARWQFIDRGAPRFLFLDRSRT